MQFYSDFPKPGVDFVDVSPVFQDVEARKQCLGALTDKARNAHADLIVAVESRGFIYGAPIADRLDLPLVIVRKPGKLPGPIFTQEVKTEYSETKLQMQKDAIPTGSRVIIVDDVLATGGSVTAARALVEQAGGVVVQYLFHVVLDKFESEQRANGIPAALVEKLVLRSAALLPPPPLPSFVPFVSGVVGIGYGQNQPWVKNRVLILYHPAMKRLAESLAGREPWRFELAPPIQWNSFDDSWPNIKFPAILHGRKVLFLFSMSSMSSFAPQASLAMVLPRQGVKSLHIVIPYFAPGTMEKITEPGVLATADTFARMLSADMPSTPSGPPVVSIFDIHNGMTRFCFRDAIRLQLSSMVPMAVAKFLAETRDQTVAVCFPDEGSKKRFQAEIPKGLDQIVCAKTRIGDKRDVKILEMDKPAEKYDHVLIVDDLVHSGGTIDACHKVLKNAGVKKVSAFITHPVFTNDTFVHFLPKGKWEGLATFWITNSIPEQAYRLETLPPFKVLTIPSDHFLI